MMLVRQIISSILVLGFISSCTRSDSIQSVERKQLLFGDVEAVISVTASLPREQSFKIIQEVFEFLHHIDATFSPYKTKSELNHINGLSKPAREIPVSKDMQQVLKAALKYHGLTMGYFDLTFESKTSLVGSIKLTNKRLDLLHKDLHLNPTGLVKGYAVDKALELLASHSSVLSATVALGGDVGQFSRVGSKQKVAIKDPREGSGQKALPSVNLSNSCVSTAGFSERGDHIKNTKKSSTKHLQVTVLAPSCLMTDALSTSMVYMPENIIQLVLKQFSQVRVILIDHKGQIKGLSS